METNEEVNHDFIVNAMLEMLFVPGCSGMTWTADQGVKRGNLTYIHKEGEIEKTTTIVNRSNISVR